MIDTRDQVFQEVENFSYDQIEKSVKEDTWNYVYNFEHTTEMIGVRVLWLVLEQFKDDMKKND